MMVGDRERAYRTSFGIQGGAMAVDETNGCNDAVD